MRILAVIPHYHRFDPTGRHGSSRNSATVRASALAACILSLRQTLGGAQGMIDIARRTTRPANQNLAVGLDVLVCTSGDDHVLGQLRLPPGSFRHMPTSAPPRFLGFACHQALLDNLGRYDWYCYLEDDIIVLDPLFMAKQAWFQSLAGADALLMPNRFELAPRGPLAKVYLDGDLHPQATARLRRPGDQAEISDVLMGMRVRFVPALNPHSGCFFATREQMRRMAGLPGYPAPDVSFIGPLESAATLAVMRAMHIYKPAPENAGFLEVEHRARQFASLIGRSIRLKTGLAGQA